MIGSFSRIRLNTKLITSLLHHVAFPVLAGFLLDLPWIYQMVIAFSFFTATVIAKNFTDALLYLWQAIAVAAFLFLLFDYASEIELNQNLCALSVPAVWILVLIFKKQCDVGKSTYEVKNIQAEIVGIASTAALFFIVPRGQLQNLNFLAKGEDSALYMWSSSGLLRGQSFNLATGFGASSYLYFYTFLNNGFLSLSRISAGSETKSLLISLNVLSNAWIFVLFSTILFSIRIASLLHQRFSSRFSNFGIFSFVSVSSFLYFRASQDVGHFTQYLLNCVALVFLLTLISASRESQLRRKIVFVFLALVTALALVGSYGPWLPISLVGIALAINAAFPHSIIRVWFESKYWFAMVLIFVIGWVMMLKKLYTSSNLEMGGGVAVVPLEAVWLVSTLVIALLGLLSTRWWGRTIRSNDVASAASDKFDTLIIYFCAVVLLLAIVGRTSSNQLTTLSFLVLLGLVFRPITFNKVFNRFEAWTLHQEFDGVLILAFISFLYGFSIYALSRFIGPIYEPMYAGNKSMFAIFGQFSWLLILLFLNGEVSSSRVTRMVRNLTIGAAILLVLGQSSFIRYDEVQTQWWHAPFLEATIEDPDALIACVNPILTTDYEAYKCNHFVSTLTKNYTSVSFEQLSLGGPGVKESIKDWFNGVAPMNAVTYDGSTNVIVISQADLNADALSMFDGVSKNMIDFRVVNP